ncbi:MAG: small multi-drug export protein [Bacillota bacterium]
MQAEITRWAALVSLTLIPWIELRGSIPLGLAWNLPWWWVFAVATAANALIFLPTWAILALAYERWLKRTFVRALVEGVRHRGQSLIEKYGTVGLALFVAIPLPGTGAYSGTVLAFLMGIPPGRAFAAVAAGVLAAGVVVTLLSTGVITGIRLL